MMMAINIKSDLMTYRHHQARIFQTETTTYTVLIIFLCGDNEAMDVARFAGSINTGY